MNAFFPNPIEHAASLIESCGTLEAARAAADVNCDFAYNDKDFRYWSLVRQALTAEAACLAN
jgi:hypothetical protein